MRPLLTNQIKLIVTGRRWSAPAPLLYSFRASGWRTQYRTLRVTSATLLAHEGWLFKEILKEKEAGPSLQSAWSYSSRCSGVGVARLMNRIPCLIISELLADRSYIALSFLPVSSWWPRTDTTHGCFHYLQMHQERSTRRWRYQDGRIE